MAGVAGVGCFGCKKRGGTGWARRGQRDTRPSGASKALEVDVNMIE